MELIVKLILSYFLGSISGSMLMGKLKGADIREMGSGNAGGTNAFRTMGAAFALGVLCIDVLKGFIAVKFVPFLKLGGILTTNSIDIELLYIICICGGFYRVPFDSKESFVICYFIFWTVIKKFF